MKNNHKQEYNEETIIIIMIAFNTDKGFCQQPVYTCTFVHVSTFSCFTFSCF